MTTGSIAEFMQGGSQLGDVQQMPDSGTLIKKPNGEIWLRSGTVALTSLYPQCAGIEHMMVHGQAAVTLPAVASVAGIATNGAGTIVAAYGNNGNVLVSTNYGASWTLVATGIGGYISDVCWNGSRFILASCNGTTIYSGYSTNGTAWTVGGTIGGAIGSNTARIAWDGTTALIVGSASATAASTPDGVTLTVRTLSAALTNPVITVLPGLGASRWYVAGGSGAACQSTAADGSAWANRTTPSATYGFCSIAAGLGYLVGGYGTNIWRSTTGADGSWVSATLPLYAVGAGSVGASTAPSLQFDGTQFIFGSGGGTAAAVQFAYSTDLVNFTHRQIAFPSSAIVFPFSTGANICFLPYNSVGASYASNWRQSSEYVGLISPTSTQPSVNAVAGIRTSIGYVRVK